MDFDQNPGPPDCKKLAMISLVLMLKSKKTILAVIVAITVAVLIAGIVVFLNITEKPSVTVSQNTTVSSEQVANVAAEKVLLSGSFVDGDAIHKGSGNAKVIQTDEGPVLSFENFKVTNGPDLFVYLSPNPAGEDLGSFASLGKLQKIEGNQVYALPDNYQDYETVVIWCRAFSTTFSTASLVQP